MAYLLSNSVFVHTPKTGGQWVTSALQRAGLVVGTLGAVHADPAELHGHAAFRERAVKFTFVRHPLSWYPSMWAHRMDEVWGPIDDPDWFSAAWITRWAEFTRYCRADDFESFVMQCTERFPRGFVSMLYECYTQGCDFIGRQENLEADLLTVLERAGECFDPDLIRLTREKNVRGGRPHRRSRSRYTQRLVERVMKAEQGAVERFQYHAIPAGLLDDAPA